MASFTPRLLYPCGKKPQVATTQDQESFWIFGRREYLLHLAGTEPRILGRAACSPVTILLTIQKEEGTCDVDLLNL